MANLVEVVAIPLAPHTLEVADIWDDGTIDTFPNERDIGAICHPDGTALIVVNDEGTDLSTVAGIWAWL